MNNTLTQTKQNKINPSWRQRNGSESEREAATGCFCLLPPFSFPGTPRVLQEKLIVGLVSYLMSLRYHSSVLLALTLIGLASSQLSISWSPALQATIGPDAFASLPQYATNIVAIKYRGNSAAFAAPFVGRLVSLPYFRGAILRLVLSF